jgi:hypothetical protein
MGLAGRLPLGLGASRRGAVSFWVCREELCVRDEPSSDTDLRLALVEPARQHTRHTPLRCGAWHGAAACE